MTHTRDATAPPRNNPIDGILDAIPLPILLIDQSLRIRWINKKGESLFGGERRDLTGQSVEPGPGGLWTWLHSPHPDGTLWKRIQNGDPLAGREQDVRILRNGKARTCRLRVSTSRVWFTGEPVTLMTLEEITNSTGLDPSADLETLNLIIQMARATAHDLNQPLSVLVGNLDLLMKQLEASGSPMDRINKISESADRVTEVVHRLQRIIHTPRRHDPLKGGHLDSGKASLVA
jgi:nitrogen-specific signal transduction histidine kinase